MSYSGRGADFYLPAMQEEAQGSLSIPQAMLEWLDSEQRGFSLRDVS